MLSEEKKDQYRKQLEEMKISLEDEISKLETPTDLGDFPGPDDNTDESAETFNHRSAAAGLHEELSDINSALIKIEKGTYGKCENCGQDIEEEVLDIAPESHLCKECNKKNVIIK
jgi:RNA polymerase-binding transcription factor DksA